MSLRCPYCPQSSNQVIRKGFYYRATGEMRRVKKFYCHSCQKNFSSQTEALSHKDKKPSFNEPLFRLLSSGVSQRRAAFIFGLHRMTVGRKAKKHSAYAKLHTQKIVPSKVSTIVFDEMETFEHSKCKPLSIAVAVEEGSRRILSLKVCQMPAKGRLTQISLKRYGYRKDFRAANLLKMLDELKPIAAQNLILKSDECPRYPHLVKKVFSNAKHHTFKGRRGCVVGQGELKAGGFDPLFSLNHTCAMVRDNLKTMSRRTWCTTKKPERLQDLLNLYQVYHNQQLENKKKPPNLGSLGERM